MITCASKSLSDASMNVFAGYALISSDREALITLNQRRQKLYTYATHRPLVAKPALHSIKKRLAGIRSKYNDRQRSRTCTGNKPYTTTTLQPPDQIVIRKYISRSLVNLGHRWIRSDVVGNCRALSRSGCSKALSLGSCDIGIMIDFDCLQAAVARSARAREGLALSSNVSHH